MRIELARSKATLPPHRVVHAAATVAEGPGGNQHLVGYVSAAGGPDIDIEAVRTRSPSRRRTTWCPRRGWSSSSSFNTAGKLDRKALPAPDFTTLLAEYVAPVGEAEVVLARIVGGWWVGAGVGGGVVFALGGDSILSIQLVSAARAAGWCCRRGRCLSIRRCGRWLRWLLVVGVVGCRCG